MLDRFGQAPDGQALFVADYVSNELEVIDPKRMPVERAPAAAAAGAPAKNQ
jgi:YVTN family beta-propeller protein